MTSDEFLKFIEEDLREAQKDQAALGGDPVIREIIYRVRHTEYSWSEGILSVR